MSPPPRELSVGFVVYDGLQKTSGGYRYDRKLVDYLRSAGDDVDIISIPSRTYPRGFADTFSPSLYRRLNRPYDVLLQDELCHPSLVGLNHGLSAPESIVTVAHLLQSGGPPTVLDPVYRLVERTYLGSVDGVLCTSEHTRTWVRGLSATPATVAFPGGRKEPSSVASSVGVRSHADSDPFHILFLGNVVPRKGVETLFESLSNLDGDWRATIVGNAESNFSYGRRIERLASTSDRIEVLGAVPDARVHELLDRAHVLAVPSRYESFGMVYLEAMEAGTVPIATREGGASEIVDHGTNGFLVAPGEPEAIHDILSTLSNDRELLADLAERALETATDHPRWDESMQRARRFLCSVAETAGEKPAEGEIW